MTWTLASLGESARRDKKLAAVFVDPASGRTKTVHFGGRGCMDYTLYHARDPKLARAKRQQYIRRHGATEAWADPTTAGTLSRYVLWEKPTVAASVAAYRRRFGV